MTSPAVYRRRRLLVLLGVITVAAIAWINLSHAGEAATTRDEGSPHQPGVASASARPTSVHTPAPARRVAEPSYLAPGSDPSALPGPLLIADRSNNRLVIVDPHGRVTWEFPRPGDLAPGQTFLVPDDAFFSPNGKQIIVTEEDDFVVSLIDIAKHRIVWRYGNPGVAGSAPNYLWNPDDALVLPTGQVLTADIKNCRLLVIPPGGHAPSNIFGLAGHCYHNPPYRFGSPNGAFPMRNGHYLVTEINNDWVDEMGLNGAVVWSAHPPGVLYPSDTNEVAPNRYLTADYSSPGQLVEFDSTGRLLWRFAPMNPPLDKPSLAEPLPNGLVIANDDHNDRVIIVDPRTNRIVWQYGHTGVPGSGPGYLNTPDGLDLAPPLSLLMRHASTMGLPPR